MRDVNFDLSRMDHQLWSLMHPQCVAQWLLTTGNKHCRRKHALETAHGWKTAHGMTDTALHS